jgi:hypothetical protein
MPPTFSKPCFCANNGDSGAVEKVGNFLPVRLYREILLGIGNLGLTRVAVLGNEVTGEPRKMIIICFLNNSFASGYRFARARKVMR